MHTGAMTPDLDVDQVVREATAALRIRSRRRRVAAAAALAVTGAVGLSSCVTHCNEMGYRNTLRVTATGDDVADVRLCSGEICAEPSLDGAPATRGAFVVTRDVPGQWTYDFGAILPDSVHLTLLDEAGTTLDEQDHAIDWRLVDEPNGGGCGWRADTYELAVVL